MFRYFRCVPFLPTKACRAEGVANQYHTNADFPADYPPTRNGASGGAVNGDKPPQVLSRGGSCIIGPLGEVLAGPLWDKEGILYAEVGSTLVIAQMLG